MLDVNIVLDILLKRDNYLEEINFIKQFKNLYISILSINNVFYICRKEQK